MNPFKELAGGLGNFQAQLPLACSLSKTHICSLIAQYFKSKQTLPRGKGSGYLFVLENKSPLQTGRW